MVKNKQLFYTCAFCALFANVANASLLEKNMAKMQAMDKITGRVSQIEVPVNGEVKYGSFSIVVRSCKTTPPEDTPENYAFVDVVDNYGKDKQANIFKGWMISSSPSLNAVEHPIFDVWLLNCYDSDKPKRLLLPEELTLRDEIVKAKDLKPTEEDLAIKVVEPTTTEVKTLEEVVIAQPEQEEKEAAKVVEKEIVIEAVNQEVEEGAPQALFNFQEKEVVEEVTEAPTDTQPAEEALVPEVKEDVVNNDIKPTVIEEKKQDLILEATPEEETAPQSSEIKPESKTDDSEEQLINFSEEELDEEGFELNVDALKVE